MLIDAILKFKADKIIVNQLYDKIKLLKNLNLTIKRTF